MAKDLVPREKHKIKMLEIAELILRREGLAALQARRVAQEAGCSVGTLYNIFDGLDDLTVQANSRTLEQLYVVLTSALDGATDPAIKSRLMALAIAYLNYATAHTAQWRAVFDHRPAAGWTMPEWYVASQARLFHLLDGPLAPYVPAEAERRRASRTAFAAIHGIVALSLDQRVGSFDPVEAEAQVKLVVYATAAAVEQSKW